MKPTAKEYAKYAAKFVEEIKPAAKSIKSASVARGALVDFVAPQVGPQVVKQVVKRFGGANPLTALAMEALNPTAIGGKKRSDGTYQDELPKASRGQPRTKSPRSGVEPKRYERLEELVPIKKFEQKMLKERSAIKFDPNRLEKRVPIKKK